MERKAMRFVAPSGATLALLHVAPREGELLYSPNPVSGRMFHPVTFKTISGYLGRKRIDTRYLVAITGLEKGELRHVNGVITYLGVEYHIDQAHRSIDTSDIF